MYPLKIILLLSHLFSVPTESNPLLYPSQSQVFKTEYPEGVQIQRNMPGIVSYGSVFIGSINNAMQITEHRNGPENNCKEGFEQSQSSTGPFQEQAIDNPNLNVLPLHFGSAATSGLSSKELFLAQAMEIAKAKEKDNKGHFAFTTDVHEGGKKDKPIIAVHLSNRPKTTIPKGVQSEAISFVISELFETSGKATPDPNKEKASVIYSHVGQLEMENNQPIFTPCHLKDLTEAPQQQTTTTTTLSSITDHEAYSPTKGQVTEPVILEDYRTNDLPTSTKESRSLRSRVTPKSLKWVTTKRPVQH